jgi:2-polyprenyl-6-methoxyphenol hydroxylase-like FAD-dependent oxidoreductase
MCNWVTCLDCNGQGKKSQKLRKKERLRHQAAVKAFEANKSEGIPPTRPKSHLITCTTCSGSGLVVAENYPIPDTQNYPHVAIIGGGIGGVALAVACLHRGIPFSLYERDENFEARSQGYGLTLQQASKAIEGFGIFDLKDGIVSSRHLVHTTDGTVIAEWGNRKWMQSEAVKSPKRTNIHIARQSLRLALLEQLGNHPIHWGHQLISFKETKNQKVSLEFLVDGKKEHKTADLVVGADGIRSAVRNLIIDDEKNSLRYLDCMVILGICSLSKLEHLESPLLDSATVFQTANGEERIYVMPYSKDEIMWQLSFPISELNAKTLSKKGAKVLKEEAIQRTHWHSPIPEMISATSVMHISGYPVYDRELLTADLLKKENQITVIGDAAHPMSPFKGQGANQALLDALSLARTITKECRPRSNWRENGIRKTVLNDFETEMLKRSSIKVKDSAAAAQFLHSVIVLYKADEPRGKVLKRKMDF